MTQNRAKRKDEYRVVYDRTALANSYYTLLGLHPSASAIEIRRSYRELSKRYHPDTTDLPPATAKEKFQKLNEAYATLSNVERRMAYDQKIRYSNISVIQSPANLNHPTSHSGNRQYSSAYLDPTDRPLSAGEVFALFILGITFIGCLLLAIAVGLTRGDAALQPVSFNSDLRQKMPAQEITYDVPVSPPFNSLTAKREK
ncbi:DnaJ domain-containing protein [Microcoleus sp. FACHB-68]|uniref:DnaJ domain-containing protein n=1 Tax=Microcoleus sp. FACHB-68 TaxID=2692826 RepID=UPI0016866342|nr:J domain-containing protein [Microcoleus sp. FACHB-68]